METNADGLVVKKRKSDETGRLINALTGDNGLKKLYENGPNIKFSGRGHEAKDMKNLVNMYKQWAFRMYPGLAFPDLMSKIEDLSANKKVQSEVTELREIERNRFLVYCCLYKDIGVNTLFTNFPDFICIL